MVDHLAHVLLSQKRFAEAEAEIKAVLKLLQEPADSAAVMRMLFDLGSVLIAQEKGLEAEVTLRRSLPLFARYLGADHIVVSQVRMSLASALILQKRFADAEVEARKALEMQEAQAPDSFERFGAMDLLGEALVGLQRYAEAEPLLIEGYAKLHELLPGNSRSALRRLVHLYEDWGRPEEAASWRKKLEEFDEQYGR